MCSQIVSRSSFTATGLSKAGAYDVQEVAQRATEITEIAKVANHEVAQIGAHAVGTMAQLVQGAGNVQRQLMDSGHRSEVFDDAKSKILQVSGTNLITLANTAQKEVMNQAVKHMR